MSERADAAPGPFVAGLRAGITVRAGAGTDAPMVIRAQVIDHWDAVRVECWPTTSVEEVKRAALAALDKAADPDAYVTKFGGFAVMDESASLADAGLVAGSILSIGHRWRRPVR